MGVNGAARVAAEPPADVRAYARGARILSLGIATTGVVTFAYFSLASHHLGEADYGHITLLWAVMFVIASVIYRPIEQLLSRTIAQRRAQGLHHGHPLRTPFAIQMGFAALFLAAALALRGPIEDDLFDGSSELYWILVAGVLAYAASYFARGWLAGHQRLGLYGGLVLMEATSRCLFAVAAVVGVTSGQDAIALGMAAAPFVSLVVVPFALSRARGAAPPAPAGAEAEAGISLRHGTRFALAVFAVNVAEQTLINASVLTINAVEGAALAGIVFNVLLISRAPLQLFQAVQGSLLPHLAGLHTSGEGAAEFHRAVRVTVLAIAGFAVAMAAGLLALGPWAMDLLFDDSFTYPRGGLALIALGMGFHLIAGTLNQAALARDHAVSAAVAWLLCAGLFVAWTASTVMSDPLLRVEVGYFGAAALLSGLLFGLYRRES